jgi:hypothetical protein
MLLPLCFAAFVLDNPPCSAQHWPIFSLGRLFCPTDFRLRPSKSLAELLSSSRRYRRNTGPVSQEVKIMKSVVIALSLALAIVATANLFPSRAQEAGTVQQQPPNNGAPPANPLKVALLKWYPANQTTSFKVGNAPNDVAFDGQNIWVTNGGDDTVTKLRPSDGTVLGTFNVGSQPYGITFDGANIWTVNSGGNNVTKLRASDGKELGTFNVGRYPWLAAFDGTDIWVTNAFDNSISKLRASDGKTLGTFAVGGPRGIAFDGTYIWVSCDNQGTSTATRLKLDGTIAGSFPVGAQPLGMAFDGANIWVAGNDTGHGVLTKLRASDGKNLGTFNVSGEPYHVAFDGTNIWVTEAAAVVEVRVSDGVVIGEFNGGTNAFGIAFDGANIWVADSGANTVSKL